jgi:hypothetical protein
MRPVLPIALSLSLALAACGGRGSAPEPYDPPGSTITTGRPVFDQPRRTIGFRETGVWVSNEYAGARLSDFVQVEDSLYRALIRPENAPVNNSAWYGFALWADAPDTIVVELSYEDGTHRYRPKLSRDRIAWRPVADGDYAPDTTSGTARLRLAVGPDTVWVSAQEPWTSRTFDAWTAGLPGVERSVIGESVRGRPIRLVSFGGGAAPEGFVLVISRQHPPEVTGTLALKAFLEELLADDPEAAAFRARYRVLVVPLVNPDGVDEGHWRQNAGGVDLNRDWLNFNQPEVRLVRDAFVSTVRDAGAPVVFTIDFHSTQEDVFYTHTRDLETNRPGLLDAWLDSIRAAVPGYELVEEASGLETPVSKDWFYEAFDATSVTYEVGDEQDRALIARVAAASARSLVRLLTQPGDG